MMDDHHSELLPINSESYGVVPSNSEYVTFRSVVASAPPVLETDINVISAHNMIEARRQRQKEAAKKVDPIEVRVKQSNLTTRTLENRLVMGPSSCITLKQSTSTRLEYVATIKKKPQSKSEVLPTLARRRKDYFNSKNERDSFPTKPRPLPAISQEYTIKVDIDTSELEKDDVLQFIAKMKQRCGQSMVGELEHQHTLRLSSMNFSAAEHGYRKDDQILKQLLQIEKSSEINAHSFIYGICRCYDVPRSPYNPYDLKIAPRSVVRSDSDYYTVSSEAVTLIMPSTEPTITPVNSWLRERGIFGRIMKMKTFQQYRLWKGFNTWHTHCVHEKSRLCGLSLHSGLFMLNDHMSKALLRIQALCESAASSSPLSVHLSRTGGFWYNDAVKLIRVDIETTFTIDSYVKLQDEALRVAEKSLEDLRSHVLELATNVCLRIGEEGGMELQYTEQPRKSERALTEKKLYEERDEELVKIFGKKDYYDDIIMLEQSKRARMKERRDVDLPSYTDIQQWKRIISHLARFLRLVDCLLLNLLRRLTTRGIDVLCSHVCAGIESGHVLETWTIATVKLRKERKDQAVIRKMRRAREKKEQMLQGMFFDLDDDETQSLDSTANELVIAEQIAKPQAFPPLLQIELILTPDNTLALSPSQEVCCTSIDGVIENIKKLVSRFGSILHDEILTPFCTRIKFELLMESEPDPFENWSGQPIEMTSLEKDVQFQEDCSRISESVRRCLDDVWNKAKPFELYCGMVSECTQLNVGVSMKEAEWSTDKFKFVLAKHHEQVEAMEQLPSSVREGLMTLLIHPFQEACLPFPNHILYEVNERLPVIAYQRNEDLLINIKDATHKLEKECKDVSAFVEYLSFMTKLLVELPGMEKEFGLIAKMYAVADEFDVPLPPEELALYRTLLPSFTHLKATLTYCEATKDELTKRYSKTLECQIVDLLDALKMLKNEVRHSNVLGDDVLATGAITQIKSFTTRYESYSKKAHLFMDYQARFGTASGARKEASLSMAESTSTLLHLELAETERDIRLRRLLWESSTEWKASLLTWSSSSFHTIDVTEIQKVVKHMTQTVMLLEKALPANNILPCLKLSVDDFKQSLPLLVSLRNPVLRTRHLESIEQLTGISVIQDPLCTVAKVLESSYFEQRTDISKISIQASNEATLEGMLQKVIEVWKKTEFTLVPYRDHPDMVVLSGVDDVQISLEESLVTVSTIKGSRFVAPIQDIVEEWDRRLELFSVTLDEWITCQRNWMYLESILTTPDIQRQLPREARLFSQVDKSWKELMRKVQDRSNAIWAATMPGVLETLQANNANLDKIQKCLEDYLETKRLIFSRFYFLSNDDILSILSNSKNPAAVQSKLTKCFGNIKKLVIVKEQNQSPYVKGLMSAEGETLELVRMLRVRGAVEIWLGLVETAMFEVVRFTIKSALLSYQTTPYTEWWKSESGQVVILVSQVIWNQLIEDAFYSETPRESLKILFQMWVEKLTLLSQNVSSDGEPWQRLALTSLVTIEVHARDVIKDLLEKEIMTSDDFEWTRQLRYNYDDIRDTCMIRQNNSVFEYGFEYLGSTSRLVITPLTDRCFLTLTTALHLHLGGSPGGPAGTGKTETVKDLAKGFGKQCVVFNCSEGLDFKMLARFFSGLTQSGSWCCFDEFNRIDLEVLSVVAQQLQILKRAKDAHLSRCVFEGHEIRVNPTCGFFITMNPGYAGRVELPDNLKSLFRPVAMTIPDFALIVEVILFSEGILTAGVLSTKLVKLYELSSRQLSQQNHYDFGLRAIKTVLQVAGEMRRNKAAHGHMDDTTLLLQAVFDASLPKFIAEDVPVFLGIVEDLFPGYTSKQEEHLALKSAIKEVMREHLYLPAESQVEKVIQLYNTMLVRHGVMQVGGTSGGKTTARTMLAHALAKFSNLPPQFNQNAPTTMTDSIKCMTLNPKCVSLEKLYGQFDKDSYEWSDGILATIIRRFAKESAPFMVDQSKSRYTSRMSGNSRGSGATSHSAGRTTEPGSTVPEQSLPITPVSPMKDNDIVATNWKWLVLDGPVDPVWVENLNTVMDDTRTLTLANGERVPLLPRMRIMFEVDDLSHASPATISRCGMVYMDPVQLGWRPYVERWKHDMPSNLPKSGKKFILTLLEMSVDAGLDFLHTQKVSIPLQVPDISIVRTVCSLVLAHLNIVSENGGFGDLSNVAEGLTDPGVQKNKTLLQRHPAQLPAFLCKMYLFCFITAFGSVLEGENDMEDMESDSISGISSTSHSKASLQKLWCGSSEISARSAFDMFVRDLFDLPSPYGVRLPSGIKSVFCYYFDIDSGLFSQWDVLIPSTNLYVDDVKTGFELSGGHKALANSANEIYNMIPTIDSVKLARIVELLLLGNGKILLCGHPGIGKTSTLQHILKRIKEKSLFDKDATSVNLFDIAGLPGGGGSPTVGEPIQEWLAPVKSEADEDFLFGKKKEFTIASKKLNGQTTAANMQTFFERNLCKMGRDLMGPPVGKTLVVFLDDLSMPQPEQYGAQPALEFLRQFIGSDGFYDINKYTWKSVDDVSVAATCTYTGRSPVNIPCRLLQYFSVVCMPPPNATSRQQILEAKLGRYFIINGFPDEIQKCVTPLCTAGLYLYQQMVANFKPRPSKLHYMWNMHSLNQFFHGMITCSANDLTSQDYVVRLYVHETSRIFGDRLTSEREKEKFCSYQVDSMQKFFKELATKMVFTKRHVTDSHIMFSDFHTSVSSDDQSQKRYRIVPDNNHLIQILTDLQNRFNVSESQDYHLVFFHDAVHHLVRLCRALRKSGLHVLQLGVGGTGRSSSARLAAYIAGSVYHELNIKRNYSNADLRDDLKAILQKCGTQRRKCTLFINELHITQDSFLNDIEVVLSNEHVKHWFDSEEREFIVSSIKNRQEFGVDANGTTKDIWNIFFKNVYECLHIVLCITPRGNNFRRYCRMHPTLLSACFIDFYCEWPEAALLAVATTFFRHNQLDKTLTKAKAEASKGSQALNPALARAYGQGVTEEERDQLKIIKEKLAPVCVKIHVAVQHTIKQYRQKARRYFHVTPSSYLELLTLFVTMLKSRNKKLTIDRGRLMNGIKALNMSSNMIERMSEELIALEPQLEHKARLTDELVIKLGEEKVTVDNTKQTVSREEAAVNRENVRIGRIAAEAEADLAAALPSLEGAIAALDALDKQDISEIRVYNSPPEMVRKVMEAVCVLLKEKNTWSSAKQLLGDQGLLKRLTYFDKDNIPLKSLARLQMYTDSPDFTPDNVGKISVACRSMCMWVRAIENYAKVYRYVLPKKQRFQESTEHLRTAQKALERKQAELASIVTELNNLQTRYNNTRIERDKLQTRIAQTKTRLDRANVLIKALSGEKERWTELVEEQNACAPSLVGDTLISTSAIVYSGAFTQVYRDQLTKAWRDVCTVTDISLSSKEIVNHLSSPIQVQQWYTQGLPRDPFSTDNAVLLMNSHRWPLLIDPQGQGKRWLSGMEGDSLSVIPYGSTHMLTDIENAIRLGSSVLLEGVPDTLDPTLYPILNRRACELTGVVTLVDIDIEYNKDFRLYLTTYLSNPEYAPEDCIKVTLVNFTVTFSGLQEQLLSRVVKMERPWLEQQKDKLLHTLFKDNLQLRQLEDNILETLSAVQTDILDDQELVTTLDNCKRTAKEILVRVAESVQMEAKIDSTRKKYLPVATRGAIVYFIQSELTLLNTMYNFSLDMFMNIFKTTVYSLGNSYSKPDEEDKVLEFSFNTANRDRQLDSKVEKHVMELVEYITMNLHRHVVCGMFSKHHLVYTLMVCVQVLKHSDTITDIEWNAFLHGGTLKIMSNSSHDFASVVEEDIIPGFSFTGKTSKMMSQFSSKKQRPKVKRISGKPHWLTNSQWEACTTLSNCIPAFQGLCKNIIEKPEFWQALLASDTPYHMFEPTRSRSDTDLSRKSSRAESSLELISEDSEVETNVRETVSGPIGDPLTVSWRWQNLTHFQRLMIIKALRLDKVTHAACCFVAQVLGEQYLASHEQNLMSIYRTSKPHYPILFILSPGVDPTSKLQRLIKDLNESEDMLEMLSLGRGQGVRIEEILRSSMLRGKWVFLQNCHLGHSWLHNLQKIIYNMQNEQLHTDFRLWLSSMPDPLIPGLVVQQSIKVSMEQPQGVKANLHQAFVSGVIQNSMYNDEDAGEDFRKLVFNLCLFNAVILERKKYGSLGWNIPYEFTNSDLEVCIQVLHQLMTEYVSIPWKALLHLAGEVMYGGRVTDKWDQRNLSSILSKFFNSDAIKPDHRFTSTEPYHQPDDLSIEECLSYISSLPNVDTPELFGMHQNADKTYHENTGRQMIDFLTSFHPSFDSSSSHKNNDNIVIDFLVSVQKSLPAHIEGPSFMDHHTEILHGTLQGAERPPSVLVEKGYVQSKGSEVKQCTPMENVIRHEIRSFNHLLSIIHATGQTLALCLQGDEIMTAETERMYQAILDNKLPDSWTVASYTTNKPLAHWVENLQCRIQFMRYWVDINTEGTAAYHLFSTQYSELVGDDGDVKEPIAFLDLLKMSSAYQKAVAPNIERLPRSFWLAALFFPQGLLTAVLQKHSRKHSMPIDTLSFAHTLFPPSSPMEEDDKVTAEASGFSPAMWGYPGPDVPDDGVLLHGLYLDGGRWDGHHITEALPGKQLIPLPELLFYPTQGLMEDHMALFEDEAKQKRELKKSMYECPIYRTSARCGALNSTGHSDNFVTAVNLPTDQPPDHWITRGLAILCQTDHD